MFFDNILVIGSQKRCFSFTPERWIWLALLYYYNGDHEFGVLKFAVREWTANFPIFGHKKYSPENGYVFQLMFLQHSSQGGGARLLKYTTGDSFM